jgi:hypothetical protein
MYLMRDIETHVQDFEGLRCKRRRDGCAIIDLIHLIRARRETFSPRLGANRRELLNYPIRRRPNCIAVRMARRQRRHDVSHCDFKTLARWDKSRENCSCGLHLPLRWFFSNTEHLKVLVDQVSQKHVSTWWDCGMCKRPERRWVFLCRGTGAERVYLSVGIYKLP